MRITCPYCGERDHAEFAYRGDAAPKRPTLRMRARHETALPTAGSDMIDYVYLRENRPGVMREWWQHTGGCRAWIGVERDVTSHVIKRATAARDIAGREAPR